MKPVQQKDSGQFLPQSISACFLLSYQVRREAKIASPLIVAPFFSALFFLLLLSPLKEKGMFRGKAIFQFCINKEKREMLHLVQMELNFIPPGKSH